MRELLHLNGKETIGIYPLLADNTSWFIVAGFDEASSSKKSWMDECRIFMKSCASVHISAYLDVQEVARVDMFGFFLIETIQQ